MHRGHFSAPFKNIYPLSLLFIFQKTPAGIFFTKNVEKMKIRLEKSWKVCYSVGCIFVRKAHLISGAGFPSTARRVGG